VKKSSYRSILNLAGWNPKSTLEDLKIKTNKLVNATSSSNNNNTVTPVDVLSTTPTTMDYTPPSTTSNKTMPSKTTTTKTPCDHSGTTNQYLPRKGTSIDVSSIKSRNYTGFAHLLFF
jgi:hypothetical protein